MDSQTSNVLHVAAALNLSSFVREIVDHNPELALRFDEHGLTPCHLAVANGHLSIVKELLYSKMGDDVCCLRDKGGFLPIHTAVMKGRVDVLKVVNDACRMWMFQELTWQGDNIRHLALKFDSLEAFRYLWHFFSGDNMLLNGRDAEGNTLLHLAVAKGLKEIVKMLLDKVDLNAINLNGLKAFDILFNLQLEHGDRTLGEMIRKVGDRRTTGYEASESHITRQPDRLESEQLSNQPSSPETNTDILFYLRGKLFDFRRSLSRRAPLDKDREAGNTLMVVATLIAAITFQSALNPPGGFIEDGKNSGMAVMERYLGIYLFFNVMAFNASLSVILLTIYVVPKWKDLIQVAMFITWVSVFFTFMSFQHAIVVIFGKVIRHPLIVASLCIGDGIVLVFALLMFIYSWCQLHKIMSTLLQTRSTNGILGGSKIIATSCLAFLGAALVWLPVVMLDISRYYM